MLTEAWNQELGIHWNDCKEVRAPRHVSSGE